MSDILFFLIHTYIEKKYQMMCDLQKLSYCLIKKFLFLLQ